MFVSFLLFKVMIFFSIFLSFEPFCRKFIFKSFFNLSMILYCQNSKDVLSRLISYPSVFTNYFSAFRRLDSANLAIVYSGVHLVESVCQRLVVVFRRLFQNSPSRTPAIHVKHAQAVLYGRVWTFFHLRQLINYEPVAL